MYIKSEVSDKKAKKKNNQSIWKSIYRKLASFRWTGES